MLTEKNKAILKSYLRALAGAAVGLAVSAATDIAPQYAMFIGAAAGPALKWADAAEKAFGRGTK